MQRTSRCYFIRVVRVRVWADTTSTRSGTQDFVLSRYLCEFSFQALVFTVERGGLVLESSQLSFEVFHVSFFAFSESALAEGKNISRRDTHVDMRMQKHT